MVIGSNTNNKKGMRSLLAASEQGSGQIHEESEDDDDGNMLSGYANSTYHGHGHGSDDELEIHDDDFDEHGQTKTVEQLAEERLALTDLSRIRRAMGSKYVGYDYPEIIGPDGMEGQAGFGCGFTDNASLAQSFRSRPSTSGGLGSGSGMGMGIGIGGSNNNAGTFSRAQSASGMRSTPIKSPSQSNLTHSQAQSPYDALRLSDAETRPSSSGGIASNYNRMSSSNSRMSSANRTIDRIKSASAARGQSAGARGHSAGGTSRPTTGGGGGFYKNSQSGGGGNNPHGFFHDDATATVDADSSFANLGANATVIVDMDIEHSTPKAKHRYAQDVLLLAQMKVGVLPEQLIASGYDKNRNTISIDVSHYGLGDDHGKCLGLCLGKLDSLDTLKLGDNRLTSSSVPTIITHLTTQLLHLDLSQNELHGAAAVALAQYFLHPTSLIYLNTSTDR